MDYAGRIGLDVSNFKVKIGGFTLDGKFLLLELFQTSKAAHD